MSIVDTRPCCCPPEQKLRYCCNPC